MAPGTTALSSFKSGSTPASSRPVAALESGVTDAAAYRYCPTGRFICSGSARLLLFPPPTERTAMARKIGIRWCVSLALAVAITLPVAAPAEELPNRIKCYRSLSCGLKVVEAASRQALISFRERIIIKAHFEGIGVEIMNSEDNQGRAATQFMFDDCAATIPSQVTSLLISLPNLKAPSCADTYRE